MSCLSKRDMSELLVYGYVRAEIEQRSSDIPEDVINLFIEFYHENLFCFKVGDDCIVKEENVVEFKSGGPCANSCYGSLVMPSISNVDITYRFEIKIIKMPGVIGVGIDDAECKCINQNYTIQSTMKAATKHYCYICSGALYACDQYVQSLGSWYQERDVIAVIYNPYKRTLTFEKNGVIQPTIYNVYGDETLSYRPCVYMAYANQIVQFLE